MQNAFVFQKQLSRCFLPYQKAAEPTGYSEEYLDAYSLHLYAYADAGIEKETAEEWAKKTCDLLIGK